MSFAAKVAVITGAGSGMGRELALQLADAGADLALCDMNEAGLAETAAQIEAKSTTRIVVSTVDVTDRDAVAEFARTVTTKLGRVDLLFNNAGISNRQRLVHEYDYSDYERILNVNLWGVIHCTHEFLPHLLKNPGAQIVNLSSIFGLVVFPYATSYAMSKFAVRAYSEGLRADLENHEISISSVHPGVIATNLVKTAGAPDDVIERFEKTGMSPRRAAQIILKGVAKRKPRIRVVWHAYLLDWIQRLMPVGYNKILLPLFRVSPEEQTAKNSD